MPPKGKKKNPNDPCLIPEDIFVRATKLKDLKVAMKQPKGEFTSEEWCIAPAFQTQLGPEFKQVIHYWKQCAIVAYAERKELKAPTRMKLFETDAAGKKPHTRKEIQDVLKYLKTMVKQANKRTGQFLKQLEKRETKETKRSNLLGQIAETDRLLNEELRNSRTFTERQELFAKKYMMGSKLGDKSPKQKALIVVECSDKQHQWVDETKDEIIKLLNLVIRVEGGASNLNIATFSASGVNLWMPSVPFQAKDDAKKGIDDAIKWLGKNFSAKTCGGQAFPPDWNGMLNKLMGEGASLPFRTYICCSKAPGNTDKETLELLETLRQQDPPAKGEPVLPINIVAFDPTVVGDKTEEEFLQSIAGPEGSFLVDTSFDDLQALDRMLKAVGVKKKQLDKLNKKLDKMEDLSEKVAEDRELFHTQVALQRMLENDFEITDWALKVDTPILPPEI